jgi:hypothetical protein
MVKSGVGIGTGARENTGSGMMVLVEGVGLDIIGGEMVKLVEFVNILICIYCNI